MALTKQELEFCEQYVRNGKDGPMAAIEAGYDSPSVSAHDLLEREDIKAEIKLWEPQRQIDPPAYWAARAESEA